MGEPWRTIRVGLAALGFLLLALGALFLFLALTDLWYRPHAMSDTPVYLRYAVAMALGGRPYVDFPVEYPPLALPLFALPLRALTPAVGDRLVEHYSYWFNLEMLVVFAAAAVATSAAAARLFTGRRPYVVAGVFALGAVAIGLLVLNRYDAAVALVFAACLLLLAFRRWIAAAVVLGIGFALKLAPALLLPIVLVLAVRKRALVVTGFAIAASFPFVPYLVEGPQVLRAVFGFHLQRPLQVESVLATPLLVGHLLGVLRVEVGSAFGSQFIAGPGARALAQVSAPLSLVAIAATYGLAWRRRGLIGDSPRLVPLAALAVILAFLACGKVLSPQFLIWILPAIALIAPERPALAALMVAVLVLTHVEFPANYWRFVALERGPVALVVLRNLALVAALALALLDLWRLPAGPPAVAPG